MMTAFKVLYFAWLKNEEKQDYKDLITTIIRDTTQKEKRRITEIQEACSKKWRSLTSDGKERKKRILEKLFYTENVTRLHMKMYMDILPMFKSAILVLEQKEPLVHRLHEEQEGILKSFLACFIKHEVLADITAKKLKKLDVKAEANHLPESQIFLGKKSTRALSDVNETDQRTRQTLGLAMAGLPMMIPVAGSTQKTLPVSSEHWVIISAEQ